MNPNVLFILYCLIATPIYLINKMSASNAGVFVGYSLIPAILVAIYNFKKNKTLRITASIVVILWILITVFGTIGKINRLPSTQSQYPKQGTPVDYEPFASNQAKQRPSFKSVDEELAYMNANPPVAQPSNDSSAPGRNAYLKMLDSYISDGTPAVRLATVADPAFSTFLSLKDAGTGRLIKDIAEEADRKQDAATVAEVYKSFFKWRQNTMSQR